MGRRRSHCSSETPGKVEEESSADVEEEEFEKSKSAVVAEVS